MQYILYISQYQLQSTFFETKINALRGKLLFSNNLERKELFVFTKVIFISVESSNLGIMLNNTTY